MFYKGQWGWTPQSLRSPGGAMNKLINHTMLSLFKHFSFIVFIDVKTGSNVFCKVRLNI